MIEVSTRGLGTMINSVNLMNYGKFCRKKTGYGAGASPGPGGACQVCRGRGPAGAGAFTVSRGEGPRRGKPRAPEDTGQN